MPKKTSKKAKHQSFKLTPHKYSQEKVVLYVIGAVVIGAILGWLLKDDFGKVIYGSAAASMGY
jgi:hypothetical protein